MLPMKIPNEIYLPSVQFRYKTWALFTQCKEKYNMKRVYSGDWLMFLQLLKISRNPQEKYELYSNIFLGEKVHF